MQYREAAYLIFVLRDRAQGILIFVISCSTERCGNISTRAIACVRQVTCDNWYVMSLFVLRARRSSLPSSSIYVRTRSGNPIIRRLYRKHTGYRRQSHWNVLNGTNVLTYVLFDRPFSRSRAGICATAIIRYRNIIQASRFKHCENGISDISNFLSVWTTFRFS